MIVLPPREQSSITVVPTPPWSDAQQQQEEGKMEKNNIPTTKETKDEERVGGGGGGGGLEAFPFLATTSSSATSSSPLDNTIEPKEENTMKDSSNNSLRILSETLTYELRAMKEEITALRDELRLLGGQSSLSSTPTSSAPLSSSKEIGKSNDDIELDQSSSSRHALILKQQRKKERKRQLEQLGPEVERWAKELLSSSSSSQSSVSSDDNNNNYYNNVNNNNVVDVNAGMKAIDEGWKEITCNSFVRNKFNKLGKTRVYLKWMPDSRTNNNEKDDVAVTSREEEQDNSSSSSSSLIYPCIRCHATIDAPLDQVCSFLSNPNTIPMYNELIDDHRDIEIITPSSKVTWCKVPKILFVKPRDFVTYCSHRWLHDGTQVIINQAIDHEDVPGVLLEGTGNGDTVCRGYALRGANFISRDPSDPNNKTCITMVSHANPGGGLPQWAMNTAINAVVQVEPFKFFHKMNESICNYQEPDLSSSSAAAAAALSQSYSMTKNVGIRSSERSTKPAGIAHLGFTCFWPYGGGLKEEEESGVLRRNSFEPIQTTSITAEVEAEAEGHGV
jgi:molybdopterin converting factor small subunit